MGGAFDYGNTRLRARRAGLLRGAAYEALIGLGLGDLLGALARTAYAADVEQAAARFSGLACLEHALQSHLERELAAMRSFFSGSAGALVERLLSRWDLRNLLTILRGVAAKQLPEDVLPLVVSVGSFDEAATRDLVQRPDLRQAVDRLVEWGLPTRAMAHAILDAWPLYHDSRLLSVLEHAASCAYVEALDAALDPADPQENLLLGVLLDEVNRINLLSALRLREARNRGEVVPEWTRRDQSHLLPGGVVTAQLLWDLSQARSRAEVLAAAASVPALRWTAEPLAVWADDGELTGLANALQVRLTRRASGLIASADPLGVAVAIAYAYEKENEIRNLRLLGYGQAHGVPTDVVSEMLVILE